MRVVVLPLFLVVALAAGCGMSPDDARATWSSVRSSLGGGPGPSSSASQALEIEVGVELDCENGGEMELDARLGVGDEDVVPDGYDAAFAYEIRYDACSPDENTLDGALEYLALVAAHATDEAASVEVVYVYRGELTVSGETQGTCLIDMQGRVDASAAGAPGDELRAELDVTWEGTLCGQDASEVLRVEVSSDDA